MSPTWFQFFSAKLDVRNKQNLLSKGLIYFVSGILSGALSLVPCDQDLDKALPATSHLDQAADRNTQEEARKPAKYRLCAFIYLFKRKWQNRKKFVDCFVGLAGENKTNNITRGLQNISQSFTNQLSDLSTVISVQGVSQVRRLI